MEPTGGNLKYRPPRFLPVSMVKIAFVCVENAGRSQMAAAFARARAPAGVDILSGGTLPAAKVDSVAIEAMREVGIELSDEKPTKIGSADLAGCDVVVTMGCSREDVCPATERREEGLAHGGR